MSIWKGNPIQFMKKAAKFAGLMVFILGLAVGGCQKESNPSLWKSIKDPAVASQLKLFIGEKQAQAEADDSSAYPGYASFLAAAQQGDRIATRDWGGEIINQIQQFPSNARWHGTSLQVAKEIVGAFDAFGDGDPKYSTRFGNAVIQSIPPGSIYFGGTDPGRFVVTAMQTLQIKGDPFFTLTQNALADSSYLDYLRSMYSNEIYLPTKDDLEACVDSYYRDAKKRLNNHQLKPGEDVSRDPISGRIRASGIVAVMQINGMLVKVIFDHNTNHEFYIEQSFPLDWMYPYLEPHGLIFKLNREPLARLSDDAVQKDHDDWTDTVSPLIGEWLNDDTPVSDVAAFSEKVFLQHNFSHFNGDPEFVQNTYSPQMFSRDRCSIAGLYAWRAHNSTDESEKERMNRAADFAYRQAWALCPYLPDVVFGYTRFLTENNDPSNALLVAETAAKFTDEPGMDSRQMEALAARLKQQQTK
jgi:hypothetical protein